MCIHISTPAEYTTCEEQGCDVLPIAMYVFVCLCMCMQGCWKLMKGGVAINRVMKDTQLSKEFLHEAQKNSGLLWACVYIYICMYMTYQGPHLSCLKKWGGPDCSCCPASDSPGIHTCVCMRACVCVCVHTCVCVGGGGGGGV